ncbi:helix-turn-helix domain-containing protein [Gordonia polyisoprenivorans]|uniref:helix-turn-helix domain-containing protein n=1 Tax=Gordonia polyisoprenivorans TaxID=84595 RepID=UPI00223424F8
MTVDRAAELLDVHPRTIRRAIERGEVRARYFGRCLRVETRTLFGEVFGREVA